MRTYAAAARRSHPSAAVGSSRRQPPNTFLVHTTRDFVVAVSRSVTPRPLVSVCVLRRTHTRGGGGIRLAEASEIREGNTRKIILSAQRRNYKLVYCPEGRKLNKPLCVGLQCRVVVRPHSQFSATRVRAVAHTCSHARKSASHRRPSIAAHDRCARPRRWASLTGDDFPDSRVLGEVDARPHAWPDLPPILEGLR